MSLRPESAVQARLSGAELPHLTTAVPGPRSRALAEQLAVAECPALTARRARRAERSGAPHDPIVWVEAAGANVRDADGNVYVDLTGGFAVAAFAHAYPPLVEALARQQGALLHALGDVYPSDAKIRLLTTLSELAPWPARVILGLSGADAVEAALKTAVLATGRPGVVAFEGGYHGLSHGPLALCGYGEGFRAPFAEQLNPHVHFAPFPAADEPLGRALEAVVHTIDALGEAAGALIVEPVQGRGGVRVPPPGFVGEVCALARARGLLVIVDEIYTGLGRSGALFLHREQQAEADLVCIGKALGGGVPVSACLGREEVMRAWGDPAGEALHTSTFLGNPPSCAAALCFLEEYARRDLPRLMRERGLLMRQLLAPLVQEGLISVTGVGFMLGLSPRAGADAVLSAMRGLLERGYLTCPAGAPASVLCLTPPVCISDAQLAGFCEALREVLRETRRGS